jgi:hypothetical protein
MFHFPGKIEWDAPSNNQVGNKKHQIVMFKG